MNLFANRPASNEKTVSIEIAFENGEDVDYHETDVTGQYYLTSQAARDPLRYELDTWEFVDLSHLPEEVQEKVRSGHYDDIAESALNEAELL